VAAVKLCVPCLNVLNTGAGTLCVRCKRRVAAVLQGAAENEHPRWPPFWVPEEGEAVGVPGMTRMGKSSFQKAWQRWLMDRAVCVYAWDPAREMSIHGLELERTPRGPLQTQVTVSELEAAPALLRKVEVGAKRPAVAIVPDSEYPIREERAADFVRAMKVMLPNKVKGDCVLFLGECGLLEGDRAAEEMMVEIATTWGKEGVASAWDTQCTSMVPDRARRQWRTLVAFKQVDVNDRQANTRLVSRRFAKAVRELPPHTALLADRLNPGEWDDDDDVSPEETGAEAAA
jgi:hypothetical protein